MTRKEVINIKKKLIFPVIAVAILSLGIIDVGLASAKDTNKPQSTLVQKIAEKFNLNQNEVQQVFDEVKNEHLAERKAVEENRLNQLVADGKITKDQKELIIKKHEELRADRESNRDSLKDLSKAQRQKEMDAKKSELEALANDNNIDISYLTPFNKDHMGPGSPTLEGGDM